MSSLHTQDPSDNLGKRINQSAILSYQEKLIMQLLAETLDRPSVRDLVECLERAPYNLKMSEIYHALNILAQTGLLELSHFSLPDLTVGARITFTHDWVLKL